MGEKSSFLLYTDGSCLANPGGNGGYGIVLVNTGTGEFSEKSEGFYSTTNNRMEVMAAIAGLSMVPAGSEVRLFSDSQYLVKTLDGYFAKKKNHDLWEELDRAIAGKKVKTSWVRGHSGDQYNERCDQLAMQAAMSPTKEDRGYMERIPADTAAKISKKSTIGRNQDGTSAWECVPAPNGKEIYDGQKRETKEPCMALIHCLNRNENPRFEDFVNLKTGGCDGWSSLKDPYKLVGEETVSALEAILPSHADVMACLRWYGRGLKFRHCIRKVLVDAEVRENVEKSRCFVSR